MKTIRLSTIMYQDFKLLILLLTHQQPLQLKLKPFVTLLTPRKYSGNSNYNLLLFIAINLRLMVPKKALLTFLILMETKNLFMLSISGNKVLHQTSLLGWKVS